MANGQLSHDLARLITVGNHIAHASTMQPVVLRGVNRSGLEYSAPGPVGFLAAAGISKAEIEEIVFGWQAKVIRLPFNQEWVLHGFENYSGEDYMTALDTVIDWAASLGAYTILDLHWLDISTVFGHTADGRTNHVPPLPNPETIALWRTLAQRYKDEAAVIFDLLNEPHSLLEDDSNPVFLVNESGDLRESSAQVIEANEWLPWASRLISEVRSIGNDSLLFVSGLDWGYDLSGLKVAAQNIVFSTHVYPNRRPKDWQRAFGRTAAVAPVFVAEWGGGNGDLDWGARFISFLNATGLGWASWSWTDQPYLVGNAQTADYSPTRFGSMVRRELMGS